MPYASENAHVCSLSLSGMQGSDVSDADPQALLETLKVTE